MAILRHVRVLAAVVVTAATGCDLSREETIPGPSTGPVTVQAILRAGDDTVRVVITRTRFSIARDQFVPVPGAEVWIHGPAGSVALEETGLGLMPCLRGHSEPPNEPPGDDAAGGCYVGVLPARIQPGERYGLNITLPDGSLVEGETYVPTPATLTLEGDGRVAIPPDGSGPGLPVSIGFAWSRGADAVAVAFDLMPAVLYEADQAIEDGMCSVAFALDPTRTKAAAGTGQLQVYGVHCIARPDPDDPNRYEEIAWDSVKTAVYVVAENPEYEYFAEYQLVDDALPLHKASVGIRGAIGVFGAVATTGVPIVFVRGEP